MSLAGSTLGHYAVSALIGRGGMGEIYMADDLNLGRKVALKFLPDAFAGDPERMARLEREAKLLASLNHPNIAAIYGIEQIEGKRFLAMEYVDGQTLAQRTGKGAIPAEEALAICRQIAEGLEAAHEKGVIHRDLKPANVMVTEGDKVKILDFGLAKALSDETQIVDSSQSPTLTEAMTRPGVILGTAAYMSPEQAKGKAVDKRADLWAFGCILYECLTGKRAFEGETVTETLASVLRNEPDWQALPETTPSSIRTLLRRCLQKDLARRYRDAAVVRIEIEDALAFPQKPQSTVSTTMGMRRIFLLGLAAIGFLALGVITAWILKLSPSSATRIPTRTEITLPAGDSLAGKNYPRIALSPDGRRLVYAAIHNGVQQLFLRPMDSYEAKALQGTEEGYYPFFSPDSRWIGFLTTGKIKKVPIAGGPAQLICNVAGVGGVAWGVDDTVVFSPSNNKGLMGISENGGEPRVLTTPDRTKGEMSHRWPQFLPGGKALLFTIATGTGWDEFHTAALRLDTGEISYVREGSLMGRFVSTGHLIYYRAGKLLAVPFDPVRLKVQEGSTPQPIAEGVAQTLDPIGAEYSFSAEGSLAYIPASLRQFDRRLVWIDRKGIVEPLPAKEDAYYFGNIRPSLSPDGRQLAVSTESDICKIMIYDIARGILTPFAAEASRSNAWPIWMRNGKRITYTGYRAGFRNIYRKNADGSGEEEQLTTGENFQFPYSWSPNDKWLAFGEATSISYDVLMLGVDGDHKRVPFLTSPIAEGNGVFSPDGHWLAYQSDYSGRAEIYVKAFPGPGAPYPVSIEGGEQPLWARSGRELFYRNGNKMMVVDIRTEPAFWAGKPRFLFEGQFGSYDIALDDQRFLAVQPVEPEQPATKINLVLNWLEELKRLVPSEAK
ncbi:MAG: serine/threonine-protein kinase [Acidobacteria bacterium]|nr:serine/threonine-protein kinase [Acidobacteriota bacterium]